MLALLRILALLALFSCPFTFAVVEPAIVPIEAEQSQIGQTSQNTPDDGSPVLVETDAADQAADAAEWNFFDIFKHHNKKPHRPAHKPAHKAPHHLKPLHWRPHHPNRKKTHHTKPVKPHWELDPLRPKMEAEVANLEHRVQAFETWRAHHEQQDKQIAQHQHAQAARHGVHMDHDASQEFNEFGHDRKNWANMPPEESTRPLGAPEPHPAPAPPHHAPGVTYENARFRFRSGVQPGEQQEQEQAEADMADTSTPRFARAEAEAEAEANAEADADADAEASAEMEQEADASAQQAQTQELAQIEAADASIDDALAEADVSNGGKLAAADMREGEAAMRAAMQVAPIEEEQSANLGDVSIV